MNEKYRMWLDYWNLRDDCSGIEEQRMNICCIFTGLHEIMNWLYELSLGKDDESQYMMLTDLLLST